MIMSDPAIRLFGKTIHIAPNDDVSADLNLCYSTGSVSFQTTSSSSDNTNNHKNHADALNLEFCKSRKSSSSSSAKSSIISEVSEEEEQEQEMGLKKPSKLLACPRCNSADTKFCYFNNYNAKQPRHFCKGCQRYWTAGGSMRNMAVGAGRRKLKNNPSCTVGGGDHAGGATISFQGYAPIWPNPSCFFPVPVYAAAAAASSYWAWVPPASALGKHPREEQKQSVLAPKTVRFDEASDVAKSSIWSTLGIKSQSWFGGFEKEDAIASSDQRLMLGANPAALSRSLTFRETTADSQIKLGIN